MLFNNEIFTNYGIVVLKYIIQLLKVYVYTSQTLSVYNNLLSKVTAFPLHTSWSVKHNANVVQTVLPGVQ